jgi:hypothetical protein
MDALLENQFAYSGLDTVVSDPHGQPWILPVLDTAPAQQRLRNTVHKVMIHQGFGRLAASVDWNRVAEQMPMTADTPERKRDYMQRVLGGTTDALKRLKPDDAVALYDFVKLTVLGAGHGSQSVKTQELVDIYDTDNAAALKTPAAVIGRSVAVALSTNADIHWWIYALSVEALRLHVTRVLSWSHRKHNPVSRSTLPASRARQPLTAVATPSSAAWPARPPCDDPTTRPPVIWPLPPCSGALLSWRGCGPRLRRENGGNRYGRGGTGGCASRYGRGARSGGHPGRAVTAPALRLLLLPDQPRLGPQPGGVRPQPCHLVPAVRREPEHTDEAVQQSDQPRPCVAPDLQVERLARPLVLALQLVVLHLVVDRQPQRRVLGVPEAILHCDC